jgi:NAD(P)-dependent dehydrogenase (short-subunit alcohol dehydrogenase family)
MNGEWAASQTRLSLSLAARAGSVSRPQDSLSRRGATVVVIGRSPQSVGDARKEISANGVAIAADVTKSSEIDAVFQTARETYGRIDVLYANAGIAKLGSVAETTDEMFDDILNTDFRAAYFTVQKALPLLSDGGESVSQLPLKDNAFSTFPGQNPPFELRPENGVSLPTKACSANGHRQQCHQATSERQIAFAPTSLIA